MILGQLICTVGVGLLAPQPGCLIERQAVITQKMEVAGCDKHDLNPPADKLQVVSGQQGTGIEQPCKAVVPPPEKPM